MGKEQIPLKLTRARVTLMEEEDEEVVTLRVPIATALAVQADPAGAMKALAAEAEAKLAEITESGQEVGSSIIDGQLRLTPNAPAAQARQGFPVNENPELYSAWNGRGSPDLDGYYDVTDSLTGTMNERWWFEGVRAGTLMWYPDGPTLRTGIGIKQAISHERFLDLSYAWRGRRRGHRDPYPVPPYNPAHLPPGSAVSGKYVKRSVGPAIAAPTRVALED